MRIAYYRKMAEESIAELLKSVQAEVEDSKENYTSEEAKTARDEQSKEGVEVQKEVPQEEKKAVKERQVQTRQRTQKPQR